MLLTKLYYFRSAAKFENLTKAAKELKISQPTLTKTIRLFETEIGVPLFKRFGNKIALNDKGKIFQGRCCQIIDSWEEAKREVSETNDIAPINISLQVASSYFTELLERIETCQVPSALNFTQNKQDEKAEIVLSSIPTALPLYDSQVVLEEECLLAVPKYLYDKELFDSPLSLTALENIPMISLTKEYELRQSMDDYFIKHVQKARISYEVDNPSLYRDMINRGMGIALVPRKTWKLQDNEVQLVSLEQPLKRILYIRTLKNQRDNRIIQKIRESMIQFFQELDAT